MKRGKRESGITKSNLIMILIVIILILLFILAVSYIILKKEEVSDKGLPTFGLSNELDRELACPKIAGGGCRGDGIGNTLDLAKKAAQKNFDDNIYSLLSYCLSGGCTLSFGEIKEFCGRLIDGSGYTCTLTASAPCECI